MKSILTLIFSISFVILKAQPPSADSVLQEAYTQAAKENKNVFLIFHASWCIWCRKMDSAMNDPAIKKSFEKNYVIIHLTILESADKKSLENPGAIELYTKYAGPKGQGIPFWIIFDKNGKFLADAQSSPGTNTGCPATLEEVRYFITVLKKTSKISNEQLLAIEKRFRKNE